MRMNPSVGTGTLRPATKLVKSKKHAARAASLNPAADARRTGLLMYLADQFETADNLSDRGEAVSLLSDLENAISHHPDLRPYAEALRQMVAGWNLMNNLCAETHNLTQQ